MAIPGGGTVKEYKAPSKKTSVTSGAADSNKRLAAERQQTREKYFDDRADVSSDRLDRRLRQAQEYEKFKQTQMKPVLTAEGKPTGAYQSVTPGGPTLADKAKELAMKYGPTPSEIAGDIAYTGGNILKGLGIPVVGSVMKAIDLAQGIFNKSISSFNSAYDKMNDVAKEVFENKDKYPYASKMPLVMQAEQESMELLEAQRRLENLNRYRDRQLFQYYRSKFMDPAMEAETQPIVSQTESIVPEYQRTFEVTEREPVRDIKVLPPEDQTVLSPFPDYQDIVEQAQGNTATNKTESEVGFFDLLNPFDEVPIQMGINEMLNPDAVDLEEWKKQNQQSSSIIPEAGAAEMGTQVTAYNNPGNLMFANQAGAIQGETYGPGYAVFPTAEAGLEALRADLTAKVNRSNKVEDIIGQFAPRSDNPESFDNYLGFVKNRVGDTVEPNEIDELTRSVIQFENKPSIAEQYLTMSADGGMIDKQLKSLQNGLQNMYNGIPSVRRR